MMMTTTNNTPPAPALMSHCPWGGLQVGRQGMDDEQRRPTTDDGGWGGGGGGKDNNNNNNNGVQWSTHPHADEQLLVGWMAGAPGAIQWREGG
jgi:hypothetical protein